jgi:tol-pal system protein YbgF
VSTALADERGQRWQVAQVDQATQLQLQTMQNSIRYLQVQIQQLTQIKEALAQAQQHDKEQAALVEQRLSKIDKAISGSRLLELVSQVETLNADLNRMRGEIELMRNRLDKAEKQDKSSYSELSERLDKLEQGAASGNTGSVTERNGEQTAEQGPEVSVAVQEASSPGAASPEGDDTTEMPGTKGADSVSSSASATAPGNSATSSAAVATSPSSGTSPVEGSVTANAKPVVRDPIAENRLYDEALRQFRGGNYQGAISAFQSFTEKYPSSALAPNAQYWIGVSFFNQRDFSSALQSNQALIKGYPDSTKVPDAMLNIASILVEQSDFAAARGVLEEIVAKYPTSDAAAKARTRLSLLKK